MCKILFNSYTVINTNNESKSVDNMEIDQCGGKIHEGTDARISPNSGLILRSLKSDLANAGTAISLSFEGFR